MEESSLVTKSPSLLPGTEEGDTLANENVCSASRQKGGEQSIPPASAASQLPSAENNPYAKAG